MLLNKLVKANVHSPTLSPKSNSNGHKRGTLEIFSKFRNEDDLSEQYRVSEQEIEAMLD